jgi:hypothetical protein
MDRDSDTAERQRVLIALKDAEGRIARMLKHSPEGVKLPPWDEDRLRSETVELKADIKAAAKRGKINDDRIPQTIWESAFYDPAMREASARFLLRTDTSPSTDKWRSGIRTVLGEITYYIWQLERDRPED